MKSLLDYANAHSVDLWLVFRDIPKDPSRTWLWNLLKPGFQHIEVWQQQGEVWIRADPCMELVQLEATLTPPHEHIPAELNPTFLRVRRAVPAEKVRELFFIGPMTCVELTKAFIGLRCCFVRTPYQLYRFLRKHG